MATRGTVGLAPTTSQDVRFERLETARREFLAGRLDEALSALTDCQEWPVPFGADGHLLAATAMTFRELDVAEAYLMRHRAKCESERPALYHALAGRISSLRGDAALTRERFARARAHQRDSTASGAWLDLEEARARFQLGDADPNCAEIASALTDPAPRARAAAYAVRAGMQAAAGNYHAQIADLAHSLRIALAHGGECETLVMSSAVKELSRTAFEVCDAAGVTLAREAFERLALLPATRTDFFRILSHFANDASLRGDSLGAQRLLRRSEEVATKVFQRITAFVGRASVAILSGSPLWAAEEFGQASELAKKVAWDHARGEDVFVLCELARIAAEIDVGLALEYLAQYKEIRGRTYTRHHFDERRIVAFERQREGVIRARAGERDAAGALLEEAYGRWAAIDHHVRAGLAAAELLKLTGAARWQEALARHRAASRAKAWLPGAAAPFAELPIPGVENAEDEHGRSARARRELRHGRLDEACAALTGCETWSDGVAADAMVLYTTALSRLKRTNEVERYLNEEGAALREQRPVAYFAILGLCAAVRRGEKESTAYFKRARDHEAGADTAERQRLAYTMALGKYYCGKPDPTSTAINRALESTDPSEKQAALYLRAMMRMSLGDYRAQVGDLWSALEVYEAHPDECDLETTTKAARYLATAGMELADEQALRQGRAILETLPAIPTTMFDHLEVRVRFAMVAFLHGDPGLALRVLRDAERYATNAASRIVLLSRRSYIAKLTGNALWAGEELGLALELEARVDWENEGGAGIFALLEIARALAETAAPRALEFLERYKTLHAVAGGLPSIDVRRFEGFMAWSEGCIRARLGHKDAAIAALEESYRVFAPIDHHMRAALAARELCDLTNGKRWRDALFRHAQACKAKAWAVSPDFAGEADDHYASLTPTQREIFRAICDGLTVAEIARDTSRSVFTINKHLQAVYGTFHVHSRAELRAEAKRRRL